MFSFHKPKIYRSPTGCCICGAKSSSSRFTSSKRYEAEFTGCFRTGSQRRSGDICNACVLLVKRWRKLPIGTDRHWQHMLDARAGTRTLHKGKVGRIAKEKPSQRWNAINMEQRNCNASESSDDSDLSDCEGFNRRHRQKQRKPKRIQFSPFLDLSYWKKTKVCCGTIFVGANGEVMLDANLWRPCITCRPPCTSDVNSTIRHDLSADDASEISSDHGSVSSSQESNTTMMDCGATAFDVASSLRCKSTPVYELEL